MKPTKQIPNINLKVNQTTGTLILHTVGITQAEVRVMQKDVADILKQQGCHVKLNLKKVGDSQ